MGRFELSRCMWEGAVRFKSSHLEVAISFHVDDVPLDAEDECPVTLVKKLAQATEGFIGILEGELKLPVARDKTFKLATSEAAGCLCT